MSIKLTEFESTINNKVNGLLATINTLRIEIQLREDTINSLQSENSKLNAAIKELKTQNE